MNTAMEERYQTPADPRRSTKGANWEEELTKAEESSPEPAKRRGQGTQATQIPRIPEFKLGYAEKERQVVDQRVADRKQKTGYTPHDYPFCCQRCSFPLGRLGGR